MLRRANLTEANGGWSAMPFSVYFGWTTVATVANMTVLLVGRKCRMVSGLSAATWAVIIDARRDGDDPRT